MAPRWLADGICSDEAVVTAEECRGYHTATVLVERKWVTADSNFNNIFKAMQVRHRREGGGCAWWVAVRRCAEESE